MNINKIKYHACNLLFVLIAIWDGIVICGIGNVTTSGLVIDSIVLTIIVFIVMAKLQPKTMAIVIVTIWNKIRPIIYKSICVYEKIYKGVKKNANRK